MGHIFLYLRRTFEAWLWLAVLLSMALSHPSIGPHFTLCPLAHLGVQNCPGCGLGRSIMLALNGHMAESICMHPLGLLAIALLSLRIYELLFSNPQYLKS
ncbi:MAG: DUF2752 domain-containing protein [Bacteroidales bacterium]